MKETEKKTPEVSIGMPVYNGEPFIREALDSLLAQTFTDFELIISDNASTDGTEAICRDYTTKDKRIRYVRQPENRGASPNFKFVLDEAMGEYFMWAAADDMWHESFVDVCKQRLESNPEYGLAMTGYKSVSRASPLLNRSFPGLLRIIELKSGEDRLWEYTKMPFSTHKDNLVYSMWRKQILVDSLRELQHLFGEAMPIGAAMNELVLYRNRGVYIDDVFFIKRYKYQPPGHILDSVFGFMSRAKRALQGRPRSTGQADREFLQQLEKILLYLDIDASLMDKTMKLWRSRLRLH